MIAHDPAAATVRRVRTQRHPNRLARFCDFNIDTPGLRVMVL